MLTSLMDNQSKIYDSALGIRPPTPRPKYLIPAGPWLNEQGQLHLGLLRWKAKQWQKSVNFGFKEMHLEEVIGEVFKHYVSRPERLVIDWETYARICKQHLQAVQERLEAGIEIPEPEQQEILSKTAAICYKPEELMIAPDPDLKSLQVQPQLNSERPKLELGHSPQLVPAHETSQRETPQVDPDFSVNIPIDQDFQQKWKAAIAQIAKPMPKASQTRSIPRNSPQSLEEAIRWLQDPVLQPSAVTWAKRNGYCIESSEIGTPIDIYLF
ncbi:MAG: hypothetical protein ACRC8A_05555 [Microcoleaceae cyanobacterium]